MVDLFSKWPEASPIADKTATTTNFIFLRDIISRYGKPYFVRFDMGTEFKGEFSEFCETQGI